MSLLLLLAAAAAVQTEPSTLTMQEAQALSPAELATRVLGPAGRIYREARAIGGRGEAGGAGLSYAEFAGTPRSAGYPGLCVADRLFVSFVPPGEPTAREDTPRRPRRLDTDRVYRIVGDTGDWRGDTRESDRAQDAQCARAGPVLGAEGLIFFGSEALTSADAAMAARMLQSVMAEARRGPVSQVTCREDEETPAVRLCTDPRALLAGLETDRLRHAAISRCAENAAHLCAEISFELEPDGHDARTLEMTIEAEVAGADQPPAPIQIRAVSIRHEIWVLEP